ncbi:MAG: hypothetical protein KH091_13990 [Parabacteroides merdae]|nr:hypothetical protein [Parabacteroides merdae]
MQDSIKTKISNTMKEYWKSERGQKQKEALASSMRERMTNMYKFFNENNKQAQKPNCNEK